VPMTGLYVRDFAIAREVDLLLNAGLTVLTGETGAGKSLLVDALALALGARGDTSSIRDGAASAEVVVSATVDDAPAAAGWLAASELEGEGAECMVRRLISRERPTRAYVNARPVPVQSLRDLGERLVDIHGQHEHQSLMRRDAQREIVDDHAGLAAEIARLGELCRRQRELAVRVRDLRQASEEREARRDLLLFRIGEIETLALEPGEVDSLREQERLLAHAGDLRGGMEEALSALADADGDTAGALVHRALRRLSDLQRYDARLGPLASLLEEAELRLTDVSQELRARLDDIEADPARLEWVQGRLVAAEGLARKNATTPEALGEVLAGLHEELQALEGADARIESLESELRALHQQYDESAETVSQRRRKAAESLSRQVTAQMGDLGIAGGRFHIQVETDPEAPSSPGGRDRIEFQVTANPGQPLRPLARVASGGELSRISLAIQVVLAAAGRIPILVFDEVDVGIGGAVAEIVGEKLRRLGDTRQVLCVTHLPQVAAQGHHHLCATKQARRGGVRLDVTPLGPGERVRELARMLGGVRITNQSLAHAEDMLERAAS
jgi:DNA repair protein RecN (Recombination protein N)